jgi:hypothetical protein
MNKKINIGKLILLLFCCVTVIPMCLIILSALLRSLNVMNGVDYKQTVLSNIVNLYE